MISASRPISSSANSFLCGTDQFLTSGFTDIVGALNMQGKTLREMLKEVGDAECISDHITSTAVLTLYTVRRVASRTYVQFSVICTPVHIFVVLTVFSGRNRLLFEVFLFLFNKTILV